ncbi:MAG: hypothetical protein PHR25_02655 [Clostridia bacterium]|nr:hypothetical protein [Clostridia bacterium]MDD4375660.1 hypothetical protein [Clostridia bacterium]
MDNAQKAIMIGVGLFITIIIISAVLLIVNLGTGLVDDATSELGTMSTGLQNQILQNYDNKTLSGVQVRSAIQQYLNSTEMTVVLMKAGTSDAVPSTTAAATVGAVKLGKGTVSRDDSKEFYKVKADDYKNAATADLVHKTSMQEFNDLGKVSSGIYIDTSNTFKSYVLKIEGTNTIVGIVFVPPASA